MLFSISSLFKSQEPTSKFSTQSLVPAPAPVGTIIDRIDLGAGLTYSIEDTLELDVDYALTSTEIARRMNLQPEWRYAGQTPDAGERRVRAAIGRLSLTWTELHLANLLTQPECPLQGSGAWVREAFLAARPRYDGRGSILFPEAESSRWRRRVPTSDPERGVSTYSTCFPGLDGSSDGSWCRSLLWVKAGRSPAVRVCLLLRRQSDLSSRNLDH
jgi:hypothetical protein